MIKQLATIFALLTAVMSLPSFLQDNGLTISKSRGDGHCLLYSVVKSWNKQLPDIPPIDLEQLKTALATETLSDPDSYIGFIIPHTQENLVSQMMNYLHNKEYNSALGDATPLIVANSFHVNVVILNEGENHQFETKRLLPSPSSDKTLYLHRKGDHFNGIVPLTRHVLVDHVDVPVIPQVEHDDEVTIPLLPNTAGPDVAPVLSLCTQDSGFAPDSGHPNTKLNIQHTGQPTATPFEVVRHQSPGGPAGADQIKDCEELVYSSVTQKLAYSRDFLLQLSYRNHELSDITKASLAQNGLFYVQCHSACNPVSFIPVRVSRHRKLHAGAQVDPSFSPIHRNLIQVKVSGQVEHSIHS